MGISNKKRKYIKRHAGRKPVAEIANDLGLLPQQVTAELEGAYGQIPASSLISPLQDNLVFRLILALVFLAPFVLIDGITDYSDLPKKAFIGVGALLILNTWLMINFGKGGMGKMFTCRLFLPLAIFLGWALISLSWTIYRFLAIAQWAHWTACALVFFIAVQELRKRSRWESLLKVLTISASLISLLGMLQHLFAVEWVGQTVAPAATFANRNMAGHFIVMAYPAAVYLFFTSKKKAFAWMWVMAATVMLTYTSYTFTRAAWVCLALETGLFILYFLHDRLIAKNARSLDRFKLYPLLGAFIFLAVMTHLGPTGWEFREKEVYYRVIGIWDSGQNTGVETETSKVLAKSHSSIKDRLFVWNNSLRMIRDHLWIGVGVHNYRIHFPATLKEMDSDVSLPIYRNRFQAHNDYLQLTAELGLAGLIVILWMVWEMLRMALILLGPGNNGQSRFMSASVFTALAGMSVNALFSFPLYSAIPPLVLALYAALLVRMSGTEKGVSEFISNKAGRNKPGPRFLAIMAIALALLAGFGYLQFQWLLADRYISKQRKSISGKLWQNAIIYGEKVRAHNPYRKDTLNYTGRAYLALEELEKAKFYLEKVDRLSPWEAGNLYHRATVEYNLGNYEQALPLARKATESSQWDGGTHYLLGQIFGALGNDREALESFRVASLYSTKKNLYHYNQGYYAYKEKLYAEAASALQKSIELEPDFELAHKYLGYALFYGLNKKEQGILHLKASLEVNANQREAEQLRKIIADYEKTSP